MQLKEINNTVKEKVVELHDIGFNKNQIVKRIKEDLKINLSYYNVSLILDNLKENIEETKEEIQKLNNEIKEEKKLYDVSDDHYIFYLKVEDEYGNKESKPFPISIALVDSIFKDYSKYGGNLSSEKILQKYAIKPELWHALKSRLRLYKDSNILSPITLQRMTEDEAEQKISDVIDDTIQSKYKKSFVEVYNRKKEAQYKKMAQILSSQENFLENLQQYIDNYEPKTIDFKPEKIENNNEIIVLFSDLHIGKMETEKVLERIRKMGIDLVKRPERKINLICLGDLFENITTEGMHPGQLQSMDYTDPYKIVMDTVEILEQLILKLIQQGKEVIFTGLTGNHDRLTKDHHEDQSRLSGLITYELIKRGLKDTKAKFNILKEERNRMNVMGYNVILHHGDNNAIKKNSSQILWELGDKHNHNIIVMGHVHHFEGSDLTDNSTKIIVPAMAGKNKYDSDLLLSSYTGYIVIEKDEDGTPLQIIRRFNI